MPEIGLDHLAGMGITVSLGGKPHTITALSPLDFAAFSQVLRQERYEAHWRAAQVVPPEERERIGLRLLAAPFSNEDLWAHLETPRGWIFMIERSVQKMEPDFSLAACGATWSEVVEAIGALVGISRAGTPAGPPGAPDPRAAGEAPTSPTSA